MTRRDRHIVACPRPLTQAEQLALALAEGDQLESYITGFVWPAYLPQRLFSGVFKLLTGRTAAGGIDRRRVHTVPSHLIRSIRWLDVGRSVAAAMNCSSAADFLWEYDDIHFAKTVCRFLSRCEEVHGFEHSSLEFFRAARKEGCRTVLHLASVHPTYQERILNEQYEQFPELRETADYCLHQRRHRRDERRLTEFELADLIVTCSDFATHTLVQEGISVDRVLTVPLGAPPLATVNSTTELARESATKFSVLFAGTLGVRKGAHLLLESWKRAKLTDSRLLLAGHNSLHAQLKLPPGVEILGPVSQKKLFQLMQESDVMALPTLIESFGLVITEALAHGLPVITTTNAGAADLIEEGDNGWLIAAGDVDALTQRLIWCAENRERLRQMRCDARKSIRQNTWPDFRQRMREALAARGFYAEAVVG